MDCLVGYIGLANGTAANSGLYLSDLPGISAESVAAIANGDQSDAEAVLHEVEVRAIAKFRTLFTREMNRCWRISNRSEIECIICENKELIAVALWYLIGAEMMLEKINSERVNRFTVTKKDYQELANQFLNDVFTELQTAVAGIDIANTTCIQQDAIPNNLIQTIYTKP